MSRGQRGDMSVTRQSYVSSPPGPCRWSNGVTSSCQLNISEHANSILHVVDSESKQGYFVHFTKQKKTSPMVCFDSKLQSLFINYLKKCSQKKLSSMENGICEIKFLLLALSRFLSRKLVVVDFGQRKGGNLPVATLSLKFSLPA